MPGRPRPRKRTTTEAGLGWDHVKAKRALLAVHTEGDPCPYGRGCLYYTDAVRAGRAAPGSDPRRWIGMFIVQRLDAGHSMARVLGSTAPPDRLEHARCNRSHGARLGNLLRGGTSVPGGAALRRVTVRRGANPRW